MITFRVNPAAALGWLTDYQQRQLPYAVSLALNRSANKGQEAERSKLRSKFKLRREQFVVRGIKIAKADRATKSSWRVVVAVAYPDDRHFLDDHEEGAQRVRHGGKRLWQPNAEVFKSKVIGRGNPLHPKNLKLHKDKGGRIVGDQRTFLVRVRGQVLILQHVDQGLTKASRARLKGLTLDNVAVGMGPHRRKVKAIHRTAGTRLLYRLVDRVRIPARLEFVPTVGGTAAAAFPDELRRAMAEAIR